jgi:hypothetical protein
MSYFVASNLTLDWLIAIFITKRASPTKIEYKRRQNGSLASEVFVNFNPEEDENYNNLSSVVLSEW